MYVLPVLILIGGICNALVVEPLDQAVQRGLPERLEPGCAAEPAHQGRADSVVQPNEDPAGEGGGQLAVPEAAEGPYLGTVIGAIYRCGNVAAALLLLGYGRDVVVIVIVIFRPGRSFRFWEDLFLFLQILNQPHLCVQRLTAGSAKDAGVVVGGAAGRTAF